MTVYSTSTKSGAWLLLTVFSIGVLTPVGSGRWLLCVGCDDVGLTLTQTNSGWFGSSESRCEAGNTYEGDQQPDRVIAEENRAACDCMRASFESHDFIAVPTPTAGVGLAIALIGGTAAKDLLPDLPTGSITARGPPDAGWLPATQTLLGQHTSLII